MTVVPAAVVEPVKREPRPVGECFAPHPVWRAVEVVVTLTLAVVTLPLSLAAAIAVRLDTHGPVLYRQVRLGRGGRPFTIIKFRSMTHNCEAKTGVQWATKNDARVTAVGRVLRALHIDELPQLWNVFRGEMSLVGPRPERPEIMTSLDATVPEYRTRLRVNPGVTGLAQIQLPADADVGTVRRKLQADLCYIDGRSWWLDVRIAAGTVVYLTGASYGLVQRLVRLPAIDGDPRASAATTETAIAETVLTPCFES